MQELAERLKTALKSGRLAAKPFGVEPARGGLPQQRLVGKSLVRRA